ncbi:hypothetical protein PGUG_04746 [Meyerozyma guilliermondii ATCC 6260]|uniref:DUF202 domain-containing protein n=3 Tax=cellular organisms TaxID=131567 RepID=A5DN95_PICGU|nr:uncharacterized protein PGUG_04746 [Meyerozyma guilliermondii ATCC 6260]EDK40648.1 hypothetical protein PGUG_04746 [Meyerozyma guilliermondii ATCC 6260]KAJ9091149.1 hypothetical protein QFC19_009246 [Naganishia cerealis]
MSTQRSSQERLLPERQPSRLDVLTKDRKLDVRAHQRTYEGAYTRTALGCLSFAILVIKLFSTEFLPIGVVYTAYGSILYFLGLVKSASVDIFYNPKKDMDVYMSAGNSVLLLTSISLASYIAIFVLIIRL